MIFDGPLEPLPAPITIGGSRFELRPGAQKVVRHATGYELYSQSLEAQGLAPQQLAKDLPELLSQVALSAFDNESLKVSAGIFIGNTIIEQNEEAFWQVAIEPEVCIRVNGGIPVVSAVDALTASPSAQGVLLSVVAGWRRMSSSPKGANWPAEGTLSAMT